MKQIGSQFNEDAPLYNIRIVRNYVDFVLKNFPGIRIDDLLSFAGITKLQFNDFGYWCSQKQINKFHEIVVEKTGQWEISRYTGRHLIESKNIFSQYMLGFKSPISVARQVATVYSNMSLGATAWGKKNKHNEVEIFIKPKPGVEEKLFQCWNRIGCLEGVYKAFSSEFPKIEHPECYHKGADLCRYVVSWNKPDKVFKWNRIRHNSIILGAILAISAFIGLPINYALVTVSILLAVVMCLSQYVFDLEKNKIQNNLSRVSHTAEDYCNELNIRYSTSKLVQEVGEITSVIQNEREISTAVSAVMSKRLDYDRAAILMAKDDNKTLYFASEYGFTKEQTILMNNSQFSIDDFDAAGIFQKALKSLEPILIEDVNEIIKGLNIKNQAIFEKLNIQSMICVPIAHDGESLGVMVVDSRKPQHEIREGDINLLMAVAAQTALSIAHARAFRKLQESEKKHRTLVETVRDIVYTVDLEGRFSYISPMIEFIAGYNDQELLGRKFIEIVAPSYKESVMQRFIDGIEAGGTSTYEIEIIAKDNRTVPLEVNVTSLTNNKGQVIGRIGVARDITRRKQEEAERKELEVKVLTQDKLASLGEIATGVAHEINQPLSYIKIILESTLNDIETDKVDKLELSEDFNESLRQIGKISNIISHLRTFGRSDVTSLSPVDLSNVLDDTLILMNERLRIKNISLDLKINENLPMLYGNQVKLEQVFINLIQNSMDAIEEQGKGKIVLSAQEQDDHVVILYSDTGEGIAPQMKEKIFDPFFTTKEPGKGTGIGLSIVYGIIQEHNGAISCESEEGKGAAFKIKLPLYSEEIVDLISPPLHA